MSLVFITKLVFITYSTSLGLSWPGHYRPHIDQKEARDLVKIVVRQGVEVTLYSLI